MVDQEDWLGCNACVHRRMGTGGCAAYPNGIPIMFASGDLAHFKVVPGQVGDYVYKKRPPKKDS